MTVKDLKEIVDKYPDDMLVITQMCSDYCSLPYPDKIQVIHNPSNDYFCRYYKNQHTESPDNLIEALYFDGN